MKKTGEILDFLRSSPFDIFGATLTNFPGTALKVKLFPLPGTFSETTGIFVFFVFFFSSPLPSLPISVNVPTTSSSFAGLGLSFLLLFFFFFISPPPPPFPFSGDSTFFFLEEGGT